MMLRSAYQCRGGRHGDLVTVSSFNFPDSLIRRRRSKFGKPGNANLVVLNSKRANLSATRKGKIQLPCYGDGCHFNEFLSHPAGTQSVLNTSYLHSLELLDSNTYRCILPKIEFFKFEATPVIDLRVNPTPEDCVIEMLGCKFQGSELVQRQNEHFSALMRNRITWNLNESNPFLEADVKLNFSIEIYTKPFSMLPTSAVEAPMNVLMQALLDRLVPLLLQQMVQDYDSWARQRIKDAN